MALPDRPHEVLCAQCREVKPAVEPASRFCWCLDCWNRAIELFGHEPFAVFEPTPEPPKDFYDKPTDK